MNLFQFDLENKTLIIFITSIIWAINFRATFKNIDAHMDSGSYRSLKFEHTIILSKNALCCLFFIGYYIESKLNKSHETQEKQITLKNEGSMLVLEVKNKKKKNSYIFSIFLINNLKSSKEKIIFSIKMFSIILLIYFTEEIYFIIANNHILDRLICPIRNIGILITLLIFSPILIKKSLIKYRHQFIPLIIIFVLSILIISFNATKIERFDKIFGLNFIFYLFSFILMGLETILVKYLIDYKFISMFLILGIKGLIGTIIFSIISLLYTKVEFFNFFDKILEFESEDMYEIFGNGQKVIYIFSLVILQYLKIYIINKFTENHILCILMITDIIYFPLYCIERFEIQEFGISTKSTFYINNILGFINLFLMLIFNEILECKFWGLDKNLKKNINKRQDKEIKIGLSDIKNSSSMDEDVDEENDNDEVKRSSNENNN